MDMEIFRKYEYDLFDEDSMFIQYSNHPARLHPPPGYVPKVRVNEADSVRGKDDEQKSFFASDYEIDLASRAYDQLFEDREFSFHGLKAEVVEKTLSAWKSEIEEELRLEVFWEQSEMLDLEGFGLDEPEMNWSGSRENNAQDRAWQTLFRNRSFDIEELRPEVRIHELARWRAEIVRMNGEDHHRSEIDRANRASHEKYYKVNELDDKVDRLHDATINKSLLEQLERSFSLEFFLDGASGTSSESGGNTGARDADTRNAVTRDVEARDAEALDTGARYADARDAGVRDADARDADAPDADAPDTGVRYADARDAGVRDAQEFDKAETDFNKILFGDESHFLLSGAEQNVDYKIRMDIWADDAFGKNAPGDEHAVNEIDREDLSGYDKTERAIPNERIDGPYRLKDDEERGR